MQDSDLARYARHIVLPEVGGPGQVRLGQARILVIGAGGIGSPALLYLAAAGIGHLGIVDDDTVDLSNLQRQIIHGTSTLGQAKTASAAARLGDLNPTVTLDLHTLRLDAEGANLLFPQYDLILDGSDSGATRMLVADAARTARRPLVSAAVIQFSGQLTVFKSYLGAPHPCIHCLHPVSPTDTGGCSALGVLGPAAGVMGALAAVECIKQTLDIGDDLSGSLMLYDALTPSLDRIRLPRRKGCSCGEA